MINQAHKDEAAIVQTPDGKLLYQCFHDSCKGKTWHDARQIISGDDRISSAQKQEAVKPRATHSFKLQHVGDLDVKQPDFLIRPLLEWDALAMVFGDPGCGKSFIGIDIGCCVATRTDFHGLKAKQGPVVYIAGEGQNGIGRRLMAWSVRNKVDIHKAPFFVSTAPAAFCDDDHLIVMIESVDEATRDIGPPALIVVDTVARNFGPGDENSTVDMTRFIAACDRLRVRYRCTVLLIHHSGHADKLRARGSMALKRVRSSFYAVDCLRAALSVAAAVRIIRPASSTVSNTFYYG